MRARERRLKIKKNTVRSSKYAVWLLVLFSYFIHSHTRTHTHRHAQTRSNMYRENKIKKGIYSCKHTQISRIRNVKPASPQRYKCLLTTEQTPEPPDLHTTRPPDLTNIPTRFPTEKRFHCASVSAARALYNIYEFEAPAVWKLVQHTIYVSLTG